jgi:hypothetical protein
VTFGILAGVKVQIRLAEALGPRFAQVFEDLEVRTETVLMGELADRAALHGVLARLRDLDLQMIDLRVEETETGGEPA